MGLLEMEMAPAGCAGALGLAGQLGDEVADTVACDGNICEERERPDKSGEKDDCGYFHWVSPMGPLVAA